MKINSAKKLAAKLFCIAAAILLVVLLFISSGARGQMKTIDKAYNSFTHGLYKEYSQCFGGNVISESEFDKLREEYIADWGEDFSVSADFVSREKDENGYNVNIKVTVYNESTHEKMDKTLSMEKSKGKWVIMQ